MDLATVLGIISGIALFTIAIVSNGSIMEFIHVPSILIVLGGTFAATLINYPLQSVLAVSKILKNVFMEKSTIQMKL